MFRVILYMLLSIIMPIVVRKKDKYVKIYSDQMGPKFKKPSFAILGAYNMFNNKFDQNSTEDCPEIF